MMKMNESGSGWQMAMATCGSDDGCNIRTQAVRVEIANLGLSFDGGEVWVFVIVSN